MAKYVVQDSTMTGIANAVRGLDGDNSSMTPAQMASRIAGASTKADRDIIADEYDSTSTYAVGDYCIHEGGLYVCATAISTAEAWTEVHWEEVTVGDELTDVKGSLNQKYEKPSTGIPASDLATGVIPDVSGKLDAPQTAGTQGQVLTSDGQGGQSWEDPTGGGGTVTDVQVNGASVLSDGVANVPVASASEYGVVKVNVGTTGIGLSSSGILNLAKATEAQIKAGTNFVLPFTVGNQHISTFYGLAKAAGDATQSQSANAVGVYTEEAQSKIHEMLDAPITVSGTTPTITGKAGIRYICGEVSVLSITAPESGCIDVVFTSGSTPTVLTVTSAKTGVTAIKWMNDFDPTALDANTTYELNILDGELGVAGAWT